MIILDITFDFRTDANGGDPDITSPMLQMYHKTLWSKPLPNGMNFNLDDTRSGIYLYHKSELGEFFLSSDSVIPTFIRYKRTIDIIEQLPKDEVDDFFHLSYTIRRDDNLAQ